MPILQFKLNQDRRHQVARQQHKLTNSLEALFRSQSAHDASLPQRGSLTVCFTEETAVPRTTQGGQP